MATSKILLGIEHLELDPPLSYPYFLVVNDQVIKSFEMKGTALIELAAQIDKQMEATNGE